LKIIKGNSLSFHRNIIYDIKYIIKKIN